MSLSRKFKRVDPAKSVVKQAILDRLVLQRNYLSDILREPDKWLSMKAARNPGFDGAAKLKEVAKRETELTTKILKLQHELVGDERTFGVLLTTRPQVGYCPDPNHRQRFDEFYLLEKYLTIWHEMQPPKLYPWKPCRPDSGLLKPVGDPLYVPIDQPDLTSGAKASESFQEFTVIDQADYFGVSFDNMFIWAKHGDGQNEIEYTDGFKVASIETFEFPAAACNGTVHFFLKLQQGLSPAINGLSGRVVVQTKWCMHKKGDQADITELDSPLYQEVTNVWAWSTWFNGGTTLDRVIDRLNVGYQVSKDDVVLVHLATVVDMRACLGITSFNQGAVQKGYTVVLKPSPWADSEPGLYFKFTPAG